MLVQPPVQLGKVLRVGGRSSYGLKELLFDVFELTNN